jgi:hypothetical protein
VAVVIFRRVRARAWLGLAVLGGTALGCLVGCGGGGKVSLSVLLCPGIDLSGADNLQVSVVGIDRAGVRTTYSASLPVQGGTLPPDLLRDQPLPDGLLLVAIAATSGPFVAGVDSNVVAWGSTPQVAYTRSDGARATLVLGPSGRFCSVGSLRDARATHQMALPADPGAPPTPGDVLVVGGFGSNGPLGSVEAFVEETAAFEVRGGGVTPRRELALTRLGPNGLLVAGGLGSGGQPIGALELLSPSGGVTPFGALAVARAGIAAVTLEDGSALLTAGFDADRTALAVSERVAPEGGLTSSRPAATRAGHGAAVLSGGQVLVAGGIGVGASNGPAPFGEIFDPAADQWVRQIEDSPVAIAPRIRHTVTSLRRGQLAVMIGGQSPTNAQQFLDEIIIHSEALSSGTSRLTTSATARLATARAGHTTTLLPVFQPQTQDAETEIYRLLVAGGQGEAGVLTSAELVTVTFNTRTRLFIPRVTPIARGLAQARMNHAAVARTDGTVLLTGGQSLDGSPLATAELFLRSLAMP